MIQKISGGLGTRPAGVFLVSMSIYLVPPILASVKTMKPGYGSGRDRRGDTLLNPPAFPLGTVPLALYRIKTWSRRP